MNGGFEKLKRGMLRHSSPDHYRLSLARFPMRPVLLCILLVCGLATPVYAQQLKEITNSFGMKLLVIAFNC